MLPPNKSRVLYFTEIEQQRRWLQFLKNTIGENSITEFYDI